MTPNDRIAPFAFPTSVSPLAQKRAHEAERAEIEYAIKKRKEREQAQAEARESRLRQEGAERLTAYREQCLTAWLHNGGDERGFGLAWPDMQERYLIERATGAVGSREERIRQEKLAQRERHRERMI